MSYETKEVKVTYGLVSKRPHERNIAKAIAQMGRDGWRLVSRADAQGVINVVGVVHTLLVFQRESRY